MNLWMFKQFRKAWDALERQGWCDSWHSVECARVRQEWIDQGYPRKVKDFIRRNANRPPATK